MFYLFYWFFQTSKVTYMIQKRSCSSSTKVDGHFHDTIKVLAITIKNVNIFIIYVIFQSVAIFLLVFYLDCAWFIYKKLQVQSTIHELFGYNFLWNFLGFSNKLGLTIQMRIFSYLSCLKFGERNFFSSQIRA